MKLNETERLSRRAVQCVHGVMYIFSNHIPWPVIAIELFAQLKDQISEIAKVKTVAKA
jgi:hypothetical protein